ncbi:MAG: hypothetical protein ACK5NT_10720 [Pyrinomonadaceae bacterium]
MFQNRNNESMQSSQEFLIKGKTQTRVGSVFAENITRSLVRLTEKQNSTSLFSRKDFSQSSDAIVDQLGADFAFVTNKLLLKTDIIGEIESILNMQEVQNVWEEGKPKIYKKYGEIPDFNSACETFEENLKSEETLLESIRDKGDFGILFPKVSYLGYRSLPCKINRERIIRKSVFLKDLAIRETIAVKQTSKFIEVRVLGKLDEDNFDYSGFLNLLRQMFDGDIQKDDISFQNEEIYTYEKNSVERVDGKRHQLFTVDGWYFRDEKQELQIKSE